MDIETKFEDVREELETDLSQTSVEVRMADETLAFWKDGEHTGLEIPKSDIKGLHEYFSQQMDDGKVSERVQNKVKQDTYYYLVLKYL